jgi:hypothetical protein
MQRSELVNFNLSSMTEPLCHNFKQKRRERINDKLRLLQQLIPNGTKVSS